MAVQVKKLFREALSIVTSSILDDLEMEDYNACMATANFMLDTWSAQNLIVRATKQENFPLAADINEYTIGVGATFNTDKPIRIVNAFIRDSSNTDYPIEIVGKDVYDNYLDKTNSRGMPVSICYDAGDTQQDSQKGTIFVYFTPDQAYSLFIESYKYFKEFDSINDVVTFEPAYFEAIIWNLAERLWPKYNRSKPVSGDIRRMARQTLRAVENMNSNTPRMTTDLPGAKVRSWNVYSGI